MATVIRQSESAPEEYNALPDCELATLAWQRVEPYIAWRFSPRACIWVVEGPGEWSPPLTPAVISTVEIWSSADEWESVALNASPLGGYYLPCSGPYRFTAVVGTAADAAPPDIVQEAIRRVAEYLAADSGEPGAASERVDIPGVISEEVSRVATWRARAMQNSGAADLLRTYRRA